MDLTHRVAGQTAASKGSALIYRISTPLNYLIPLGIIALSLYQVWPYFGQAWETGSLSLVFLPFVGRFMANFLGGEDNPVLSTIILIGYALGPVSFYAYVRFVTGRHLPAIVTAIVALLPLFPFSPNMPERMILALVDRDGGHVLGLTAVPWISIVYHMYLRSGQAKWQYLAAFLSFLVGLVSFFAFTISLVFLFYVSASEALVAEGRIKLKRFFLLSFVMIIIFGLVYNISLFPMFASSSGKATIAVLINFLPLTFFIVPILGTFAFLIFDRRPLLQPVFLTLAFTVTFAILHMVSTSFVDVSLLDRDRYGAELSFALSTLIGILALWAFELIRNGKFITNFRPLAPYKREVAIGVISVLVCVLLASFFLVPRGL